MTRQEEEVREGARRSTTWENESEGRREGGGEGGREGREGPSSSLYVALFPGNRDGHLAEGRGGEAEGGGEDGGREGGTLTSQSFPETARRCEPCSNEKRTHLMTVSCGFCGGWVGGEEGMKGGEDSCQNKMDGVTCPPSPPPSLPPSFPSFSLAPAQCPPFVPPSSRPSPLPTSRRSRMTMPASPRARIATVASLLPVTRSEESGFTSIEKMPLECTS
jgi:hypothetical protein